jgi:predicted branched-subunit amino acid permease
MAGEGARSDFWRGVRAGLPVAVSVIPFGVLFGALAIDNGFTPFEAVLMSATVYAGASQMVGLQLFGEHVPAWLIVFSIFAVNFRHVLYSAAVGRRIRRWSFWQKAVAFFFLVDPQYAEAEREAEKPGGIGFAWYMGMGLFIYTGWVAETWIGALAGRFITDPHALGLDFLLPIYFLGLVMEFRRRPLWLPVVVVSAIVSVAAYHIVGSPWHVSIGAVAGILLAAFMPTGRRPQAVLA